VDQLGGIDQAIETLQRKAKLPLDREARLVVYPGRKSFWQRLMSMGDTSTYAALTPEEWLLRRAGAQSGLMPFVQGGMLRVMPYRVEIR
jgi:hypothetical protein